MRLFAVLLLILSFLIPISIKADNTLVFMDNSRSIKDLREIYRRDIENFMGITGSNQVYFAVIGDSHTRGCKILESGILANKLRAAIQKTFQFYDWHTPIYNSLKSVTSCDAFKNTDKILIISDMEPDHQRSEGSFVFDTQDIKDANNTHKLLKGWVDQGKQLYIVLHDWEKVPERDNRDFQPFISTKDRFKTLWQRQMRKARKRARRKKPKERFVREPSTNKKLVALSLLELKEYKPSAVHLFEMPLKKKNRPNHEGFRQVLCGFLPISPHESAGICDVEIPKEFSVTIEISRTLALSRYFDLLRGLIKESDFIGPLRHFKIVSIKKGRWRNCDAPIRQINTDFYFRMCEGNSRPSYRYPRLMTFAKDAKGQWLPDDTFEVGKTEVAFPNKEKATHWLASRINTMYREIVSRYYKVQVPLKTIYLVNQDKNNVLGNYQFSVLYRFKGVQKEEETKLRFANDGIVKLPIPREGIDYAKLCLNTEDGCYYLNNLDVNEIDSPSDITFTIQEQRQVPVILELSGQFQKTTFVEIFHKGGALGDEKVSVYKKSFHSPRQERIYLLPGRYYWEVIPNDRDVLGNFGDLTILPPSDGDEKKLWLEVKNDPLADSSQWDTVIGRLLEVSGSDAYLTEEALNIINGSAYFFVALLHYSSSNLGSSPGKLRKLWETINSHIMALSTDKQRLLRRSMSIIKLRGNNDENLRNIMFDMFIYGETSILRGSTPQVQRTRSRYKRWIKYLSKLYKRNNVITPELSKILLKNLK